MITKTCTLQKAGEMDIMVPNVCPICKNGTSPAILYAVENELFGIKDDCFSVVFCCTYCNELFYAKYPLWGPDEIFAPLSVGPEKPQRKKFEQVITDLSPRFVEIYNQSMAAEEYKLNEVAGMGYRKALEIIVKDYLLLQATDEATRSDILKKDLLKCINQIDDDRINTTASRAAWIGNDEAHYFRKHVDKDITDLKLLIKLTTYWIEVTLLTKEAEKIPHIK